MILSFIQWMLDSSSKKTKVKEEVNVAEAEDDASEPDGDIDSNVEPADLDTKKGN